MCNSTNSNFITKTTAGKNVLLDADVFNSPQIQNSTLVISAAGQVLVRNRKTRKTTALARIIAKPQKGQVVDHINRNPLDNRRCNLRIATHRQNMLNRIIKNSTGFVGVSINRKKGRYCGAYYTGTKRKCFYCPLSENGLLLAAIARDKFIIQNGDEDFAPLNFKIFKKEPFRYILLNADLCRIRRLCS